LAGNGAIKSNGTGIVASLKPSMSTVDIAGTAYVADTSNKNTKKSQPQER
jgi:hypothetical protein